MTRALELLPGAIADLDSIYAYSVEKWGSEQAEIYLRALNARIQGLRRFPALGTAQEALHPGLRRIGEGSHSIYYLIRDDAVLIVRVLHDRMDAKRARFTLQQPVQDYRAEF
ncbi:toxin ParE1/3/4 [Sphingomonas sp. BE123]|uniref:type II toxin-antitoxin system RelE/ParE family toxin n=1 Tax=unclassified Sphingomonas TaxID=196159 RepID=UPI0028656BA1|nr:type II toxin-antitoxin system RelE/ParE family toxin [Sphingomonas sp. BE123]MDR6851572.1 toxin ParE1/3/4 [Sphingomonas sp. BE123]